MRPSPARKLRPWPEAGPEESATQENNTWAWQSLKPKHRPKRNPVPALASHGPAAPPYLVAPSPQGRANQCTQGKSEQARRLQWSRDESVGQDRTGLGVMSPTYGSGLCFPQTHWDRSVSQWSRGTFSPSSRMLGVSPANQQSRRQRC